VYKRCSCKNDAGKLLGSACPKRNRTGHGQWGWRIELPDDAAGNRRPRRRSGFESATAAQEELDRVRELLAIPDSEDADALRKIGDLIADTLTAKKPMPEVDTVRRLVRAAVPVLEDPLLADDLPQWLASKKDLKRNTYRSYESHVRLYLVPYLGKVRRSKLRVAHVSDMFDQIVEHNDEIKAARASKDPKRREAVKYQRPVGPSSLQRIRETLRSYLNDRIREELISFNPAKWVKLPPADRPKPLVWTPERVEHWQRTGKAPGPVMVWTPEHTGDFFDHIEGHRLYALFRLLGYCGLRRGEGCGLRLIDTHLASRTIEVLNQLVQYGWETGQDTPKTDESAATVALDEGTALALAEHLAVREAERAAAGDDWVESGLVFTEPDGTPLHPADVTELFQFLVRQAGLPPIRLHDLRHGTATLALAAGVEMKVVQHMLRHASETTTSKFYTSVLPEVARAAAEKTASIIPRASVRRLGRGSGTVETTMDSQDDLETTPESTKPQVNVDVDLGSGGTPPGTRTPNPLVKSQLLCQLS
jgi:integrase